MPKRQISARIDADLLRQVRRYYKSRSDSEAIETALERALSEARERAFWRRWAGAGGPDAFRASDHRRS